MAAGEKTVQYTKRGLKVVGTKSIFDLEEPPWIPDEKVHHCLNCNGEFSLIKRKHHCRRCGQVFCGNCVTKLPVYRMNYVDPALVCTKCEPTCTAEADFYDHHLKVLCKGAKFSLSNSKDPEQAHNCCLSPDHCELLISEGDSLISISLKSIQKIRMITATAGSPDHSHPHGKSGSLRNITGMEIHFMSGQEEKAMMLICHSHSKKQSAEWLRAFKKGMKILRESTN